ncbi:CBO2463/CBO2479 domain-containing protein [Acidipropionibacterium jensenii]|uniref:CBO2463/CBO2479 domain-containing protein n=1 Tax=Acidipropionibacterium jensenii TaxID=1749 RepID=UPI00214B67CB
MTIELQPLLLRGVIKEITEVGVRIGVNGRMGVLSLPLRCVITDRPLELGQECEFYLSYVHVL